MGWGSHHRGRNPSREPGPRSRPFDLRLLRSPRIASLDPVGRGETPRRRAARACRVFRREAPQTERCARTHIRLRQHFTGMPRAASRFAVRSAWEATCRIDRKAARRRRSERRIPAGRSGDPPDVRRPRPSRRRGGAPSPAADQAGAAPGPHVPRSLGRPGGSRPGRVGKSQAGGAAIPRREGCLGAGLEAAGGGGGMCVRGSRERPRPRAGDGSTLHQSSAGVNPPGRPPGRPPRNRPTKALFTPTCGQASMPSALPGRGVLGTLVSRPHRSAAASPSHLRAGHKRLEDAPFPGRRAQERSQEARPAKTPPRTCLDKAGCGG